MGNSWWFRFTLIVLLSLGSVWMLTPTYLARDEAQARRQQAADAAQGEAAVEEEKAWWHAYLPENEIVLGLDLQGGVSLTLEVQSQEAVFSTISRDLEPIKEFAKQEGVAVDDIIWLRGKPMLEILPGEGATLDAVRDMMARRDAGYQYVSTREAEDEKSWHRFEMTEARQTQIAEQSVTQALETLRNRIDETGVKEPTIVRKGGNRIDIQLPGVDNIKQATSVIERAAVLEFYLVDEEFGSDKLEKAVQAAKERLPPEQFEDDASLSDWLRETGRINREHRVLWEYSEGPDGEKIRSIPYVLKNNAILTGNDINDAAVGMDQFNEPGVSLEFKPTGGRIFAEVTGENVGKRFAIVLDGQVQSAPNISEKIGGGRARITMGAGDYKTQLDEASVLSMVLRTGALPAPVTIGEVRTVGASLGEDSIAAGVNASLIGSAFVVVFMMGLYRNRTKLLSGLLVSPGSVAVVAVGLNVLYIMALLAAFSATLTLPGIAGIALTVGMAVDSNIIIYERIREELEEGKTARSAADSGFENAMSAVLDANITTAIAGVVLYSYGSGPIKGFAVTLLIGIVTTLFTAVFVSRTFVELLVRQSATKLSL